MKAPNRLRGPLALLTVTLIVPVLGALAVVVERASESPLESATAAGPVVVRAEASVRAPAAAGKITVTYSAPVEATSNGAGMATTVKVSAGGQLRTGDLVMSLDERDVIAYQAEKPLWRDIGKGASGGDVARLQQVITALGLGPGSTKGTVTAETLGSIRELNRRLGRSDEGSTLHLSSLVWIGPDPLVVSTVKVRQGDAVAPGATILMGPRVPDGVDVVEVGDIPVKGVLMLVVAETSVPYERGSGRIENDADAASIAAALGAKAEGSGQIRTVETTRVASIPASAVITDQDGRTCVFTSADSVAQLVEPLGGTIGSVELSEEWIGRDVLLNPRDIRKHLTCG